jgi:hypothetical protein
MKKIKCFEYSPRDHIHNTGFFLKLLMGPMRYSGILLLAKKLFSDKQSSLLGALVSDEENKVL